MTSTAGSPHISKRPARPKDMDLAQLDTALLTAHAAGDRAALVRLYQKAGELRLGEGAIDAGCFYLTHAYIYALEQGDKAAPALRARLIEYGREE